MHIEIVSKGTKIYNFELYIQNDFKKLFPNNIDNIS